MKAYVVVTMILLFVSGVTNVAAGGEGESAPKYVAGLIHLAISFWAVILMARGFGG